jgi:PTS system ascorbate-specific IIA component
VGISAHSFSPDLIRAGVFAEDFREAILAAGDLLVTGGIAEPEYSQAMVRVVEELGPYIVMIEGVALAHAAPTDGVIRNGLSVVQLATPVDFGGGKMVRLVFALAATDHDSHIENLGALAEVLGDAETLNSLMTLTSSVQIHALLTATRGE